MSSSCWHGVTSVVMGNCGMTFAPVRPGQAEVLATAMESVEDIPASCILDGLPWDWEGYGGYLDALDRMPRGMNAGGYVGDVALRLYVAGDAACEPGLRRHPRAARRDGGTGGAVDGGRRARLLDLPQPLPPGARRPQRARAPGPTRRSSSPSPRPLAELGRGVLESAPRYNLENAARRPGRRGAGLDGRAQPGARAGRSASTSSRSARSATTTAGCSSWRSEANRTGAQLRPQMTPRSVGVLFSLAANSLLDDLPSFQPLRAARPGRAAGRAPRPRGAGPPGRGGRATSRVGALRAHVPHARRRAAPATTTTRRDSIAAIARGAGASARSRPTSTRWTPPTAGRSSTGRS